MYTNAMKYKTKSELIANEVDRFNPNLVVDIGYAQEPNSFLCKMGREVVGVDILSKPSPYSKTFVCDLNKDGLPFEAGSVDVVTMGCTLAHVGHPLRLLADINRVLKPNGTLILSSPNPHYYWEVVMNVFFSFFSKRVSPLKLEEHFYDFSRYNIRSCALVTGFEVEKEVGVTFQLVKTPIKFNPLRLPGLAYEIIYVLKKTGEPRGFGKARTEKGVEAFDTNLF